jgi:hypothetical protein
MSSRLIETPMECGFVNGTYSLHTAYNYEIRELRAVRHFSTINVVHVSTGCTRDKSIYIGFFFF